jgi:hypothetical protein
MCPPQRVTHQLSAQLSAAKYGCLCPYFAKFVDMQREGNTSLMSSLANATAEHDRQPSMHAVDEDISLLRDSQLENTLYPILSFPVMIVWPHLIKRKHQDVRQIHGLPRKLHYQRQRSKCTSHVSFFIKLSKYALIINKSSPTNLE